MSHSVLNSQSSFDRFIRRTSMINFESLSEDKATVCTTNFKNTAREKLCKENYKKMLRNALLVRPMSSPQDFFSRVKQGPDIIRPLTNNHWPVEPRNKPTMPSEPEIVLDLPDFATELWKNPVDWGSNGYIATIYNGAVYFWSPEKKSGHTYLLNAKYCIKWNRAGTQLGVSLANGGRLAILDFQQKKVTAKSKYCLCLNNFNQKDCEMCCIEWTSTNDLITGCSNGTILRWKSHNLTYLNGRKAHRSHVIKMSLSCKENYLVTIGTDNIVMVWSYPWLEAQKEISFNITATRAVAWHPWKETLLAVGDVKCFYILNVQTDKLLCSSSIEECWIFNLTFNPRSGELLLSIFNTKEETSYLRVMSNLDTVVDEIRCNEDNYIYLLWDSTGTKLGTVSTDEYLCIWNFFGKTTELEKKYLKKKEIEPFSLSLNNFSFTIR